MMFRDTAITGLMVHFYHFIFLRAQYVWSSWYISLKKFTYATVWESNQDSVWKVNSQLTSQVLLRSDQQYNLQQKHAEDMQF